MSAQSTQLESEIEARQAQRPESLRGVHEQVIRLVDNMVQNYLGNMRRTIQRFNRFVDARRSSQLVARLPAPSGPRQQAQLREAPAQQQPGGDINQQIDSQSVVEELHQLSRRFAEFTHQWQEVVVRPLEARQQSPLIDRIPPRGVELWRDFWDTVRRQVRRINQEFVQISRDMTRMITGRLPSGGFGSNGRPRADQPSLLYAGSPSDQLLREQQVLAQKFQEFYDKLSVTLGEEQAKMDGAMLKMQAIASSSSSADEASQQQQQQTLGKASATSQQQQQQQAEEINQLIDEQDDEATKAELMRNVALRQQIQQEINVFGSIFDIMRAFIQRLRESTTTIRDVLTPGAINSNDAVTPGPAIKPTVDQLLEDTVNSQRNINGQAKPVLVPNNRVPRQ